MPFMTPADIDALSPEPLRLPNAASPLERARARMVETGQWSASQTMGRR